MDKWTWNQAKKSDRTGNLSRQNDADTQYFAVKPDQDYLPHIVV